MSFTSFPLESLGLRKDQVAICQRRMSSIMSGSRSRACAHVRPWSHELTAVNPGAARWADQAFQSIPFRLDQLLHLRWVIQATYRLTDQTTTTQPPTSSSRPHMSCLNGSNGG